MKLSVPEQNSGGLTNPLAADVGAAAKEKPSLNEAVILLPPRPIPDLRSNAADPPAAVLPSEPSPEAKDATAAIEQLRRSEARFRPLQVTVREGVVTVRGSGEDSFAFAQAIRRVPGVVRVIVDPVSRSSAER
jgi:hypothetical protein